MLEENELKVSAGFALLITILVIGSGCIRNKANCRQHVSVDKNLQLPLIVSDASVIFLGISKRDYDLLAGDEKDQVNEIVADFESNIDRITDVLKKHGVNPMWTAKKILVFRHKNGREEQLFFDTKRYPVAIALFRKGKKPRIFYGLVLSDDILNVASEYFGMEFNRW